MSSALPERPLPASARGAHSPDRTHRLSGRLLWGLFTIMVVTLMAYSVYVLASVQGMLDRQTEASVSAAWNRAAQQVSLAGPDELPTLPRGVGGGPVLPEEEAAHRPGSRGQPEGTLVALVKRADLPQHSGESLEAVILEPSGDLRAVNETERHDIVHAVAPLGEGEQATLSLDGVAYRVQAGEARSAGPWLEGDRVLVVGLPTQGVVETLRTSLILTYLGVAAFLLFTMLLGRLLINRALRPLREVAGVAADVAAMDLAGGRPDLSAARVPDRVLEGADEVAVVGAAMNGLIGAMDDALAARRADEEALRRFVADASHELRTPLASVRGYAEMIALTEPLSEAGRRSIERVLNQADRMAELVDGMLVLARFESAERSRALGIAPSGPEGVVDLCETVLDAVMDARAAWPDHHWVLTVPEDGPLSPCGVPGSQDTVSRIVGNLVSNSGRHTPAGTTVHVSVDLEEGVAPGATQARLRVRDDGGGIPAEDLPGIFGRFARAAGGRALGEHSTGLGLPIVRSAARSLGGDVTVESEEGWTCFEAVLPVVSPASEDPRDAVSGKNFPPLPEAPRSA